MRSKRHSRISGLIAIIFVCATAFVFFYQQPGGSSPQRLAKFTTDPDASFEREPGNLEALIGNGNEALGGPASAEEEAYINRAYPASEVPFALSEAAQASFAKANSRNRNRAGQWSLYGPSTSTVPKTLSFYGGVNASYVTAGRTTTMAIDPNCGATRCRLWIGAAGGGVWRTTNALAGSPNWKFISGGLPSNAIGSLYLDPNDSSANTLYVGTGEANASSDSEAGVGMFKSTDGGDSWQAVGTSRDYSYARSIGSIAIQAGNPNTIYMATTRGVRGVSSVSGGATTTPPPGVAAPFGLYKSTDGGATWTFIWNGNNTPRGVRRVEIDPLNPNVIYASAYQQGLWRSTNGGTNWEQIFQTTSFLLNTARTEFDVTAKDGHTRIYVADGAQGDFGVPGATYSQVFRADNVDTTPAAALLGGGSNSGWISLTSPNPADPRYGSYDFCTGQCWYDSYIVSPDGFPDTVYLGGSHQYGEIYGISNGRGVVYSTDAGYTFTDMTVEGGTPNAASNLHPDHHWLVTQPGNPAVFFSASDGGVVRSSGTFTNVSGQCATRGLGGDNLSACQRMLARVPTKLVSLNKGLSTLQFQSVRVDPRDSRNLIGGTQDNGTWQNGGSSQNWNQTIYGDGGQAGFDVANPKFRFNTFYTQAVDANFRNGDPTKWVVISGPLFNGGETAPFYMAIISDPVVGGTMFAGLNSVWRTKNNGGDQAYLEANCSEFSTSASNPNCGDWVKLGPSPLTSATFGNRAGGTVAAIERATSTNGTLWAATSTGRVFISTNADADTAASVAFTRIDSSSPAAPGRFVSGIVIDPNNPNHAWISYGGYSALTPATPGHVFEVTYNPGSGTATWVNLDGGVGPMGDLPVTALARDNATGDLYAGTDFGVLVQESGSSTWNAAGAGLPVVEVAGLTMVPGERTLYAATHGRSVWKLTLP